MRTLPEIRCPQTYRRKWIIGFAGLLLVLNSAAALAEETGFSFRGTRWGMSEEQVRQAEGGKTVQEIQRHGLDMIAYLGQVAGKKCLIGYYFADGRLVRIQCVLNQAHQEADSYLDDFYQIRQTLCTEFGHCNKVEEDWLDESLRKPPEDWALAIAAGHLSLSGKWHTMDSVITATITGGSLEIKTEIQYCYRIATRPVPARG